MTIYKAINWKLDLMVLAATKVSLLLHVLWLKSPLLANWQRSSNDFCTEILGLLTRHGHVLIRFKILKWSWNGITTFAHFVTGCCSCENISHIYSGRPTWGADQDKMRSQLAACLSHLFLFQHFATKSTVSHQNRVVFDCCVTKQFWERVGQRTGTVG